MNQPVPPATHTAFRVVLQCVLAVGLFVLGMLIFPVAADAVGFVADTVLSVHESFDWKPF